MSSVASATRVQASWLATRARALGGEVLTVGGVRCARAPGEAALLFPGRLPDPALAEIVAACDAGGARSIACWAADTRPRPTLERRLLAAGFEDGWQPHWMGLSLASSAHFATESSVVDCPLDVPEFGEDGQRMVRMVGRRTVLFTARVEGALAGFAWLHAPPRSTTAGLFDVIVFEHLRRRGLGSALTRAACSRAAELGCDAVTLNATPMGELLYGALGFTSLGWGRTWWRHRGC